jgi:phosphate-selective porin
MMKNSFIVSVLLACGTAFAQSSDCATSALKCEEAKVHFGGALQFRYTYGANLDDVSNSNENGFSVPLARIYMAGNLNKDIDFKVKGAFESSTEKFSLADAYAGVSFSDHARVQLGQFRLPFLFEQNIGEEMQMAAQTSAFSNIFGQGYSQGVQFGCGNDTLRFRVAMSDGFNSANTNFDDPSESDFAMTARLDFAASGKLANFTEFTSDGSSNGLMFGLAGHYQDENSAFDKMYTYTADVNWKVSDWSFYAAGVGRNVDGIETFDDFGAIGQVAYRMNNFEPFARFEAIMPDTDRALVE